MLTLAELAARSGVSDRTIAKLESGTNAANPETIRCLAKALGIAPEELLAPVHAPAPAHAPLHAHAPAHAPAPALPPPKRAPASRLDALADEQRARGIAPAPVAVGKTKIPVLTPVAMQNVFARHGAFDGKRFVVDGVIDRLRALGRDEARALGAKLGIGAKYLVRSEVVPGEPLDVTVHAADAKIADALQARHKQSARCVVEVRVVGKDDARVVALLTSERKRAWAFVAVAVV
jgi:transcriptional regulator with XRE-family HTH domain